MLPASGCRVALRKESVDRNSSGLPIFLLGHWSLSARRAWIEINVGFPIAAFLLSLSARRAWIEIMGEGAGVSPGMGSLSARRAWIEITLVQIIISGYARSLSARRAWIEILVSARQVCLICRSLSARRAWIEIVAELLPWGAGGVALRKESVDRNIVGASAYRTSSVALRKESVDRNTSFCLTSLCELPSLSARRAWIEIGLQCVPNSQKRVALRKESVDRNQKLQAAISGELGRSPQGERG